MFVSRIAATAAVMLVVPITTQALTTQAQARVPLHPAASLEAPTSQQVGASGLEGIKLAQVEYYTDSWGRRHECPDGVSTFNGVSHCIEMDWGPGFIFEFLHEQRRSKARQIKKHHHKKRPHKKHKPKPRRHLKHNTD